MNAEHRTAAGRRVLYVITDSISTRFLRGQLSYLVSHGFDVHLACAGGAELDEFARGEGVTAHDVALVRSPHPLRDLVGLLQLVRLMLELRPTIVNASTPKAGLLGMLAAWLTRRPVRVYVVRGLRFENMDGARRHVYTVLERISVWCANRVIFNSRSLRRAAETAGVIRADTGVVLGGGSGNGLDFSRFEALVDRDLAREALGIPCGVPVLGFVGRLTRDKGVEDLVDAFDIVRGSIPNARLAIAGDFDDSDPVGEQVSERIRGNDDAIVWFGWLEDPVVFLRAIDVLVFPSYREGLPNTPLEAQASSTPVVGYAATGTVDAVIDGETGLLTPIGDVMELASAASRLLVDEGLAASMGEAGRRWVRDEFAQERIWGDLVDRYEAWAR